MKPIDIPTKEAWGRIDMEKSWAYNHYCGKALEQMLPHFMENPVSVIEDLYYMDEGPFQYYVYGFEILLTANSTYPERVPELDEGALISNALLSVIETALKEHPAKIMPVINDLMPVAEYVAAHQDGFDADVKIFGSYVHRLENIKKLHHERVWGWY